jgi:hypothetical protein
MFNVECIIKPLILKVVLPLYAKSKTLVFVKSKYMFLLLYNNNPWTISFNVQNLLVSAPLSKTNKLMYKGIIDFYA